MDVDTALGVVGGYRKWHLSLFLMLGLSTFSPLCWQGLSIVFIGWEPPHQCRAPPSVNNTSLTDHKVNIQLGKCQITVNDTYYGDVNVTSCTDGWQYDSEYHTIVSEWDLVCSKNYLAEASQTIYQGVMTLGDIAVSYAADRYGRKPVHLGAHAAILVVGVATVFSPNYAVYVSLRAFMGLAIMAARSSGLTHVVELFGVRHRAFAGVGLELPWVLVYLLLSLFAFLLTRWQHLQLVLSLSSLLWLPYYWILPESPVWLVANGQIRRAEEELEVMARRNGVVLTAPISITTQAQADQQRYYVDSAPAANQRAGKQAAVTQNQPHSQEVTSSTNVRIVDMVLDRRLRVHSIISSLLWLANTSVYYGLILSTPSLAGDRFLNFAIGGFVEIPANLIALFAAMRFGHKYPTCVFHLAAGIPLGFLGFLPSAGPALTTSLAMLAKAAITASFAVIVPYTRELFPTNLRGTSGALITVLGGIGATVAPFAAYAAKTPLYWLPNVVFGALSVLVGLLTLLLPETGGKALPQTLHDIEHLYHADDGRNENTVSPSPQETAF